MRDEERRKWREEDRRKRKEAEKLKKAEKAPEKDKDQHKEEQPKIKVQLLIEKNILCFEAHCAHQFLSFRQNAFDGNVTRGEAITKG